MAAPHLLILDEPTNHLDIDSRRALLDALNDYEGAVILITHDRSLIELVADRLWLTADGRIKPFAGDMDDYARFVLDRAKLGTSPSQPPASDQTAAGRDRRRCERPGSAPRPVLRPRRPQKSAAAGAFEAGEPIGWSLQTFKLRRWGDIPI